MNTAKVFSCRPEKTTSFLMPFSPKFSARFAYRRPIALRVSELMLPPQSKTTTFLSFNELQDFINPAIATAAAPSIGVSSLHLNRSNSALISASDTVQH